MKLSTNFLEKATHLLFIAIVILPLAEVPGIGGSLAQKIYDYFHP